MLVVPCKKEKKRFHMPEHKQHLGCIILISPLALKAKTN